MEPLQYVSNGVTRTQKRKTPQVQKLLEQPSSQLKQVCAKPMNVYAYSLNQTKNNFSRGHFKAHPLVLESRKLRLVSGLKMGEWGGSTRSAQHPNKTDEP